MTRDTTRGPTPGPATTAPWPATTAPWPRSEPGPGGRGPGGHGPGGPPGPQPAGPRPPERPAWRRGPWWARALAAVGLVLLAFLLAPPPVVDAFVDNAAVRYQGECTEFRGVRADSGSWPAVARAAAGRLRNVSAHAAEIRFDNGFAIYDVDFRADEVNGPPLRFGLAESDAEVRGGESTATVRFDDLERIVAGYGVTAGLRSDAGSLWADVQVPVLGVVPTSVDIVPVDGDLELRFAALDMIELPSLLIAFPEPVELRSVAVRADDLRVRTAVDGTIPASDWGCDAATTDASDPSDASG